MDTDISENAIEEEIKNMVEWSHKKITRIAAPKSNNGWLKGHLIVFARQIQKIERKRHLNASSDEQ